MSAMGRTRQNLYVRYGWIADIACLSLIVHPSAMDIDALVPQLWQRYPFLDDENTRVELEGITEVEVARWAGEYDGNRGQVFDEFARHLAVAFHERRLPFAFCDAVMNDLHTVITNANDKRPDLFWKVFLAFDAGEFHRREDKSDDPVADHTHPAIAAIIADL